MYVCICKAITDSQIKKAICNGACTLRDLREGLGVCAQCGKCGQSTKSILKESLKEIQQTTV